MPNKPVLFTSPGSHHARRVALVIHELGLAVEFRPIDVRPPGMGGENSKPDFLRINPFGRVPVLQDGDFTLSESNAIMAYLCEKHGYTGLWPADPQERAQITKWQFVQAAHLSPAADTLLYENVVKPMLGRQPDAQATARCEQDFHRIASVLDAVLGPQDYLVGNRLTCADFSVATALMYQRAARIPISDHPVLLAWMERIQARASWKATEPPPMPR